MELQGAAARQSFIKELISRFAQLNEILANYTVAMESYDKATVICEALLGNESLITATLYGKVGGIFDEQGEYNKAIEWYKKALTIRENTLGSEHHETAELG